MSKDATTMDHSQRGALWIVATGVVIAGLYWLREPLTQFAMAIILWLAIDGLTEALDKHLPMMPRFLALPIALVLVLGLVALIGYVVVRNLGSMVADANLYEFRLNLIIADAYRFVGIQGEPPTVSDLILRLDPAQVATDLAGGVRSMASDIVFTLIFLGFLFPAAQLMSAKLDRIYGRGERRARVRELVGSIRTSMERYLWVQTVVSLIITALTFATLSAIGLENALFWSFLIFFLNYIPTIGSLVATILPTAFALVQFNTLGPVAAVALGVGAWQFVIGNFVQPRMTGESLNLSAVVVLLALAIWGTIWGIAGAFLAAPLTVMLMIILAQFSSTRWIAILLSADGKPTPDRKVAEVSQAG